MSARQPKSSKMLELPLSFLVKSTNIPSNPVKQLKYNLSDPIIYILPFDSKSDLIALDTSCKKFNLPSPFEPLVIGEQAYARCWFTAKPKLYHIKSNSKQAVAQLDEFHQLIDLHKEDFNLNVQLLPVCVVWDRTPGTELEPYNGFKAHNSLSKATTILFNGRNSIVRYTASLPIRDIITKHQIDNKIAIKLSRIANINFGAQFKAAAGPDLPDRQAMFNRLLASKTIEQAIQNDAEHRKVSTNRVRKEANNIIEEIAAKFSPIMFRIGDSILSWIWSKLYKGLNVNNAEQIRQLVQSGAEILYLPCHRSHMDYLLLSYIFYTEGLVPPHAAAGINLNFFPAGPIFRRGGAFFIRRSFRGNVLYSTIFREYLTELYNKGYPIEFFPEGGRSRTGRLRKPKTGMLAMTVGAMLKGSKRKLVIVPVYIGYEHIMEVSTYTKELQGAHKKDENIFQAFSILKKLRNYGEGYVNFGEPINVNNYLSTMEPEWELNKEEHNPEWLPPVIDELADLVMTKINDAAAANGLTLCATALLASNQRALTREMLEEQVRIYLAILRSVPYSASSTVSGSSAKQLVKHVIDLDKFIVERDSIGELIMLDGHLSILMTYYRNNIIHMLAIPSLIALIFVYKRSATSEEVHQIVNQLYPFMKTELFMNFNYATLDPYIDALIEEFKILQLIEVQEDKLVRVRPKLRQLQLLGNTISETIQRYALTLTIFRNDPSGERGGLDQQSQMMAQRLSRLHNINAPEFSDKEIFTSMMYTLYYEGYVNPESHTISERMEELYECVLELISPDLLLTIEAISDQHD